MTREELLKISKPILFNTPMTQAILDDRKTVTRRVVKPHRKAVITNMWLDKNDGDVVVVYNDNFNIGEKGYIRPPYTVGDILYVRETYCPNYFDEFVSNKLKCAYKADWNPKLIDGLVPEPKWKPSIHMPKELARIFLKVIDIQVERLQDISEHEAQAEGSEYYAEIDYSIGNTYAVVFRRLWNSTIKKQDLDKYSWESNPFVWVIEFERVGLK